MERLVTKMKKILLAFLGLASTLPLAAETGADQIVWFSVSETATIEDIVGNFWLISEYRDAFGNPINAARVRVPGGDASGDRYLNLYWQDGEGHWETAEGATTANSDTSGMAPTPSSRRSPRPRPITGI